MEHEKPWTAIIPLNEEYYLALKEKLVAQTLPIIRLKSRKAQQEGHPTLLSAKPWEKYTSTEVTNLYINFDTKNPEHETFTLQKQAERDRQRGLKAVFIDKLTLTVPCELEKKERTHFEVDFLLSRLPKDSETRKIIQEEIRNLKTKHGIYLDISMKDKTYYQRIFQSPSCLEISEVRQVANPFSPPVSEELLNGTSERSQRFMCNLVAVTKGVVWDAFKKFDTKSGYVLDGVVSSDMIKQRLRERE